MAEADVLNTEQELSRVGRGVAAETIIRTGEMREEVKDTAHKEDVSLVVLGQRPAKRASSS